MRLTIWLLTIFLTAVAAKAQSADERVVDFEACFRAATRLADEVCSNAANSPTERSDCFQKARAAQLSCLDQVPPGLARSAPTAESEAPSIGSAQKSANPPEMSNGSPRDPADAVPPPSTVSRPKVSPAAVSPPAPVAIAPPGASDNPASMQVKPVNTHWMISETASPVDHSPVISAKISSTSGAKDAPNILEIACRRLRTEVVLQTAGAWHIPTNGKIGVTFAINRKSFVFLWNLSSDGRTATNISHAAKLVQSLSGDGSLKVSVFDGLDHIATFELAGFDAVRAKILRQCRSKFSDSSNESPLGKPGPQPAPSRVQSRDPLTSGQPR
jgi:hypothetical protein